MNNFLIVVVFAIVVVAFFLVGMSLTIIFKGHFVESEIADNPNMQKLGIKCASQQMREAEQGDNCDIACTDHNCGSCSKH